MKKNDINKDIETRRVTDDNITAKEDRSVEGYAIVFNTVSEDIGFREIIHRGAVTEETIKNSDIYACLNHDEDKILARSKFGKGSLVLEVDPIGLRYLFEAPRTVWGDELIEHLNRGEINASSFAFTVDKNDPTAEKWTKESDGTLRRDIYKIERLYDVSPVYSPAYNATSCCHRFSDVKDLSDIIDTKYTQMLDEVEKL